MKRIFFLMLALSFLTAPAYAGTLRYCTTIETQAIVGSTTGSIVEFTPQNYKSLSAVLTWANTAGTNPTLDVKIQSCRTKTTTSCQDWPSSTQLFAQKTSSSGVEVEDINLTTVNNWKYFRAVSTVGGTSTPKYTYTIELCVEGSAQN